MKSNSFIGLRRFIWNRRKKFILWLSELALDCDDRMQETKMRNWFLRRLGMKIGKGCIVDSNLWSSSWRNVRVGDNVCIRENCRIWGDTTIEDKVVLSAGVQLITTGHNPEDMSVVWAPIIIHKGAWIATNAIILSGAEIGEGACVAAGSIVCEGDRVPPYSVVAGVPAKVVKYLKKNSSM